MYDPTKPYIDDIVRLSAQTYDTKYATVENGIIRLKPPFDSMPHFVPHTDTIGTKGFYHLKYRTFSEAIEDAVIMNTNDCAVDLTIPYAAVFTLMLPKDDKEAISSLARAEVEACKNRDMSIVSGETAILDTIQGLEIVVTLLRLSTGFKSRALKPEVTLLGIASNGLHSNGFTLVRKVLEDEYFPELTRPTEEYLYPFLDLPDRSGIYKMFHLAGGAFTRLRQPGMDVLIHRAHSLKPQPIFYYLHKKGNLTSEEMYTTFNCGVGYVIATAPEEIDKLKRNIPFETDITGEVKAGEGKVTIESMFDNHTIEI